MQASSSKGHDDGPQTIVDGQQRPKKPSMVTKGLAPHLSIKTERNLDLDASHPLTNITLTISPTKKKRVVTFANANTSESESEEEKNSNSDGGSGKGTNIV